MTTNNSASISNRFKTLFLSLPDKVINSNKTDKNETVSSTNHLQYLDHYFNYPFPKIKWHHTSTNKINRIKSLKPKNSAGYDSIPIKVLIISAPLLSPL
jgi:hypothetical protein